MSFKDNSSKFGNRKNDAWHPWPQKSHKKYISESEKEKKLIKCTQILNFLVHPKLGM